MSFAPLSQDDLKDKDLGRLNRALKQLYEQVGAVHGGSGPFTFLDRLVAPKGISVPGTGIPADDMLANVAVVKQLAVSEDVIQNITQNIISGGGGGGGSGTDTVKLDGTTVTY